MSNCASSLKNCVIAIALLFVCLSTSAQADVPEGFKVSPQLAQAVADSKPVIKVRYPKDVFMMFSAVRLWVNDVEVSSHCLRTPKYVSYQSFTDMVPGVVSVRFEGKTSGAKAKTIKFNWDFEIQTTEQIKSITTNCNHDMGYLEDVVVQAESIPGAQAWFSIDGVVSEVPMTEGLPGKYEGRYSVKQTDSILTSHITVYVRQGTREYSRTLEKPVTIAGNVFNIIIYEPKQDAEVPLQFKIKGHTRPYATVYLTPRIGLGGVTAPYNDRGAASMGSIPCDADEKGDFELDYGFPVKLPNMQASLTFTASDREGNQAMIKQIWVNFK